jgi:quercetin dioxygenase-like cupin family protein
MPTINKPYFSKSGDSTELLETAAMTNGQYVRARTVFGPNGIRVPSHLHADQDETYEVISGTLTYVLNGKKQLAPPGTTVHLPRGIPHQHFSEGPEPAATIQTMKPAGDFDFVLETLLGLGSEGRLRGPDFFVQGMVMIGRMKSPVMLAVIPIWLQRAIARVFTPVAELFGYHAVYKRFSGEEW